LRYHDQLVRSYTGDPSSDFMVQFSKVAVGVLTDTYVPTSHHDHSNPTALVSVADSVPCDLAATSAAGSSIVLEAPVNERYVVAPRMFKHLVGKGHNEFSSSRQQDASEYFMHFLDVMGRAERAGLTRLPTSGTRPTASIFEFHLQSRIYDPINGWVRYEKLGQGSLFNILELRIPQEKAIEDSIPTAHVAPIEVVRAEKRAKVDDNVATVAAHASVAVPSDANKVVSFQDVLNTLFECETITASLVPGTVVTTCTKTMHFRTFPRYLMVKLGRYYAGPNWVQMKINARVPVPEYLDLSHYRSTGLQAHEVAAPSESAVQSTPATAASPMTADEHLVQELVSMGFSENGCRRAAIATHNSDVETAMNWILEHMEDPDFNEEPRSAESAPSAGANVSSKVSVPVDPEAMLMLSSMGYTERQVTAAMQATSNNIERAADWLFSHADNLDAFVEEILVGAAASNNGGSNLSAETSDDSVLQNADDGEGKYSLIAVISHMGKNTDHGHYVCHIKKHGDWVLFNDEKVLVLLVVFSLFFSNFSLYFVKLCAFKLRSVSVPRLP
jgi:ubiquitin carboxyl-terminal hydrolase 5/13